MDEQKPKPKAIPAPDLGYDRWILIDENTGRQNLKNLNSSKKQIHNRTSYLKNSCDFQNQTA